MTQTISEFATSEAIWLVIGLFGQTLFFTRFLVQWIASERQQKSVIPIAFWFFSLGGGIFLLAYSLYRQDPVFILGQSVGLFAYSRNLYFIQRLRVREQIPEYSQP